MRDYGKVGPGFWTGSTGKILRGDADAQIVALYLMTCPHANMIGIFYCPLLYISHETGLPLEGASKGLRRLSEVGFCTFDADRDMVWVHEMARFQIADVLKPKDNRVVNVVKELAALPKCQITQGFYEKYSGRFLLAGREELRDFASPSQAPSKPLRSQKQEQEQNKEKVEPTGSSKKRAFRLPQDWQCPPEWIDEAVGEGMTRGKAISEAERMKNWSLSSKNGAKLDWLATWRNWYKGKLEEAGRPNDGRDADGHLNNDFLFGGGRGR